MKKINKIAPVFFTDFIQKKSCRDWSDIAAIRESIRIYMLSGLMPDGSNLASEQNYQCAYTEMDIEEDNISSHIDHFKKRDQFPRLTFDWNNLFTASNDEDFGAKYKDNKYKVKPNDYQFLINPALENASDYFYYAYTGDILIKSKDSDTIAYKKAKFTIAIFNLNVKTLVEQRKVVAMTVEEYFKQGFSKAEIKDNIGKFDSLVNALYDELALSNESDITA
jgi:uncharacterized protein (TIGR02646 family)